MSSSEIEEDDYEYEKSDYERSDNKGEDSEKSEDEYGEEIMEGEEGDGGAEREAKGATTFKQATEQMASGEGDIDPKTLEGRVKLTIIKYTKEYFTDRTSQENIMKKIIEGKLYSIEELATYNIPYIVAVTIWNNKKGLINIIDPKDDENIEDFDAFATQINSKFNLADPPAHINTTTLYRYYRLVKNKIDVNIDVYKYIEVFDLKVKSDFFDGLFDKYGFNEFNDLPKIDKNNLFLLYYWFVYVEKDNSFTLEKPKTKGDANYEKLQRLVKFFDKSREKGKAVKIEISKGEDITNYFVDPEKKNIINRLI